MLHVVSVRPTAGYRLWLRFSDGVEGEVDLGPQLEGAVFAPLRDPAVFARVTIDPDVHTITWPNGADFAPEFLHGLVRQHAAT